MESISFGNQCGSNKKGMQLKPPSLLFQTQKNWWWVWEDVWDFNGINARRCSCDILKGIGKAKC